ncbi:MAG TPA: hypothetical protein VLA78_04065 [Paracoccaceae bacterium]|nr:hypothetical protein [Paracoccaceae bacterium]
MPEWPTEAEAGRIVPPGVLSPGVDVALTAAGAGLLAGARALARGADPVPAFRAALAGRARLILNGAAGEGGAAGLPLLVAELPDGAAPGPRGAILGLQAEGAVPLVSAVAVWGARLQVAVAAGGAVWTAGADPAAGAFAAPAVLPPMPAGGDGLAVDAAGWADWPPAARAHLRARLRAGARPVWSGSVAAEVLRLLAEGGLCLMPGAALPGAVPGLLAALVRAAGGVAEGPVVPGGGLILGSAPAVAALHAAQAQDAQETGPALFGQRGLFRN